MDQTAEPDAVALIQDALADDPYSERIILSRDRLQQLCDEIVALRERLAEAQLCLDGETSLRKRIYAEHLKEFPEA